MSEKIDDGGPAFPFPTRSLVDPYDAGLIEKLREANIGMSLRDYFAAHVDVASGPGVHDGAATEIVGRQAPPYDTAEYIRWQAELQAKLRYITADAMLEARKEQR